MDSNQMRIVMAMVVSTLLVLVLSPARAEAAEGLRIREVSVDAFPDVELIVSSGDGANVEDLILTENYETQQVSVESLDRAGETVDVVLVIDTSGSMQGKPMAAAIAAARSFVTEVPPNVRIGVVTFSDKARSVAKIGTDRAALTRVINDQIAAGETALFDGVEVASGMFRKDVAQRNIVLLSDGGDTTSNSDLNSAVAKAQRAGAAVFSVGLETGETDIAALKKLSSSTDGRYQPAATADLSSVYGALAEELSSQFAITYKSGAEAGSDFRISVAANGAEDAIALVAPDTASNPGQRPDTPEPAVAPEPVPSWVLPLALGLSFAAAFMLAISILAMRGRKHRETRLREAVADVTSQKTVEEALEDGSAAGWLPDMFVTAGGKVAARAGIRESLDAKLERASLALKPEEFIGISIVSALGGYFFGSFLLSHALAAIALTIIGGCAPSIWLSLKIKRRLAKINDQIPDVLGVLAGSLRAGQSFLQALDTAAREVDEPAATEFQRVVAEIRLGRSITDALEAMATRVASEGFSWAILAVNIQREVGGNLAELLDKVADTLRVREMLKRQIKTLSAEGRLSMYVLTALPFGIALYMSAVNPTYISALVNTQTGIVMLISGLSLLAAGFLWMRKVVDIDV